jgi:hypothetical protein
VTGLALSGVVLYLARPPLTVNTTPILPFVVAAASVITLIAAVTVLRSKVPDRSSEQDSAAYWKASVGPAIVLWGAIEAAGLIGAVGYFLTGAPAPAAAFFLAVGTLGVLGPGRLEGERAT